MTKQVSLVSLVLLLGAGHMSAVPPSAAAPPPASDAVVESEVTVGAEPWLLPGTLTLPTAEGPLPGVVLVHGSGPHDRDETIGPNKPFRDLARGLAARGVATLRYEKRTKAHRKRMAELAQTITVEEETVADAALAAALLGTRPEIASGRVYVLGHSLGGTVAPRIAAKAPGLAGLVILAGSTRPLEDLVLEQFLYISLSDGRQGKGEAEALSNLAKQVSAVKDEALKDSAPGVLKLPFGVPAGYWLDLRAYDPARAASQLDLPMLFLQGGRDYQVTAADFESWRAALRSRNNAVFVWIPNVNHLFIAGKTKSVPLEYFRSGHVDPAVIDIIAEWVKMPGKGPH